MGFLTHDSSLCVVLFAGCLVILQTVFHRGNVQDFYWYWALIFSGLSTVLCIVGLVDRKRRILFIVSVFLVVIWILCTGALTLKAPFTYTGNGYFACWTATLASFVLAVTSFSDVVVGRASDVGELLAVTFLSSMVVFLQTIWLCSNQEGTISRRGVLPILIISALSSLIAFMAVLGLWLGKRTDIVNMLSRFLTILWTVGTFMATFDQPYLRTGNGYFGCLGAYFASSKLFEVQYATLHAPGTDGSVMSEFTAIIVASSAVLFAAAYRGQIDEFEEVFPVTLSAISLTFAFMGLLIFISGHRSILVSRSLTVIAIILFALWTVGVGLLTFKDPFFASSNLYFGAWAALAFSWMLCTRLIRDYCTCRAFVYGTEFNVMSIASATLLTQLIVDTHLERIARDWRWTWAFIASPITLLLCVVVVLLQAKVLRAMKVIAPVMLILWLANVGILTFTAPYVTLGNAYLACWCGFLAAVSTMTTTFVYTSSSESRLPEETVITHETVTVTVDHGGVVGKQHWSVDHE